MKKILILAIAIVVSNVLYGQNLSRISHADSLKLTRIWLQFKNALEVKDVSTLHRLSLKEIRCDIFDTADINVDYSPFKKIDVFLTQFFKEIPNSKLWSVIKTEKGFFRVEQPFRFNQPNVNSQKVKSLIVYEIWYNTVKPNKNWEGMQNQFQFVKINGEFKFFGLSSVP